MGCMLSNALPLKEKAEHGELAVKMKRWGNPSDVLAQTLLGDCVVPRSFVVVPQADSGSGCYDHTFDYEAGCGFGHACFS